MRSRPETSTQDTPPAIHLHVAPHGRAGALGTAGDPLGSVVAARDLLRQTRQPGQEALVELLPGHYLLDGPIRFDDKDSRTTYRGADGTVFDGGVPLRDWSVQDQNGVNVWAAAAPVSRPLRSLFVDQQRRPRPSHPRNGLLTMASVPGLDLDLGMTETLFDGSDTFRVRAGDLPALLHPELVDVLVPHYWVQERMPIAAIEGDVVHSTRRSIFQLRDDVRATCASFRLENVIERFGEVAGEWYHDVSGGRVLYVPRPGEDLETFEATVPLTTQLVVLVGTADEPVIGLRLENITFRHTDWDYPGPMSYGVPAEPPDGVAYASAPQAAIDVPGTLSFTYTRDCAVQGCRIEAVGGYGIALGDGVSATRIERSVLRHLGAGGISLSGAEGSPSLSTNHGNVVSDNEIAEGGQVFPAGVGILMRHASATTVSHNHIHHLAYSGISCGWVWGYGPNASRDNLLEHNHIHDIGTGLLADMGGIYLLGVQPGTVVRGNLIHDIRCASYGGWGIYLDEGSSDILVEDNVCFDTATQAFHQHYGRGNLVRHNVFAFGARGQVSVTKPEDHVSLRFEHNLVVGRNRPAFVSSKSTVLQELRIECDHNQYWDVSGEPVIAGVGRTDATDPDAPFAPVDSSAWRRAGRDHSSIVGDPGLRLSVGDGAVTLLADQIDERIGFRLPDLSSVGPRSGPLTDHAGGEDVSGWPSA